MKIVQPKAHDKATNWLIKTIDGLINSCISTCRSLSCKHTVTVAMNAIADSRRITWRGQDAMQGKAVDMEIVCLPCRLQIGDVTFDMIACN